MKISKKKMRETARLLVVVMSQLYEEMPCLFSTDQFSTYPVSFSGLWVEYLRKTYSKAAFCVCWYMTRDMVSLVGVHCMSMEDPYAKLGFKE